MSEHEPSLPSTQEALEKIPEEFKSIILRILALHAQYSDIDMARLRISWTGRQVQDGSEVAVFNTSTIRKNDTSILREEEIPGKGKRKEEYKWHAWEPHNIDRQIVTFIDPEVGTLEDRIGFEPRDFIRMAELVGQLEEAIKEEQSNG